MFFDLAFHVNIFRLKIFFQNLHIYKLRSQLWLFHFNKARMLDSC